MKRLSGFFQFIIGFFLGVILLGGGAAAIGFVFFSRFNAPPPKPIFAEEKEKEEPSAENQPASSQPEKSATSTEKTETEPTPPQDTEQEKLPAGSYKARVTWSTGLSLRSGPSREADRIGGVDYNTELIVLEKSRDGEWEKVRLANGTQEGWVKAGNVEKLSD